MTVKSSRIVKPFGTGQITIPAEFRRRLKIGPDTLLKMVLEGGRIEISRLEVGSNKRVREYDREEIERFVAEDRLDARTAAKVRKLLD